MILSSIATIGPDLPAAYHLAPVDTEATLWWERTYAPPEDDRLWTPQQLEAVVRAVYAEPIRLPRLGLGEFAAAVVIGAVYVALCGAVVLACVVVAGVGRVTGGRS